MSSNRSTGSSTEAAEQGAHFRPEQVAQNLSWLITDFVDNTPGVSHAAVISADGLVLAMSQGLPRDRADQLAAVAAAVNALADGASAIFEAGGVSQTVVEMERGFLFIMSVSDGSSLAVLSPSEVDIGLVGYGMALLVERAGPVLTPGPRSELRADVHAADDPRGPGPGTPDAPRPEDESSAPGMSNDSMPRLDITPLPITIYLSDEAPHSAVEAAVEQMLAEAGLAVLDREDPVMGSWFRRMRATLGHALRSQAVRDGVLTAAHVADTRLVLAQDAAVTATMLQNVGPVITALQPTKDAVVRIGAVLIVKVDWEVRVLQLTAPQQAILDHQPQLVTSPRDVIGAVGLLTTADGPTSEPASQTAGDR
jgi:predicted regulator of Ras-like GTPase activity (Roadblock/LC7/MglB family)